MTALDKARSRRNRDRTKEARHLRLYHWMLKSEAWKSLDATARAIYIEMAGRYAGPLSNNGRISYSVREAAEALKISKATASRALVVLQERGFIVATKHGTFNLKVRHCTEWRLTEFGCDVTLAHATKDFMKWTTEKQNTVSQANRAVPLVKPLGPSHETETPKKAAHGI